MAVPQRRQCEHCGASMIDSAAYQQHRAEHQPRGRRTASQIAPGPEDQTEAAAAARQELAAKAHTPGEAERVHEETHR
ncbi:MAG: hypothetical protein AB7G21_13490 [Dehalococcoidia bacterium]